MKTQNSILECVTARREQTFGFVTKALLALCGLTVALHSQVASGIMSVSTFTSTNQLDLTGNFVAAENEYGQAVTVGGVNFTAGTTPGAPNTTFNTSPYFPGPYAYNYTSYMTYADPSLNTLMQSIIYSPDGTTGGSPGPLTGAIPVVAGHDYKLQLLMQDPNHLNSWTVSVEGAGTIGFNMNSLLGFPTAGGTGVVVTAEFTAVDNLLNISISNDGGINSPAVMLNAFTLEVPEPSTVALMGSVAWCSRDAFDRKHPSLRMDNQESVIRGKGVEVRMKMQNTKSGRATARRWHTIAVALCGLTVALHSQVASAGTFTTGTFTTPGDLGLANDPILQAFTVGPANITVQGFTFATGAAFPGVSGGGNWAGQPTFTDAGLASLANQFIYVAGGGNTMSNTISGLTIGSSYRLQLIDYDGDFGNTSVGYRGHTSITIGGDTFPNYSTEAILGPIGVSTTAKGVYLNYNFTATASSVTATFTPVGDGTASTYVLTAFDLQAIPEPSSVVLLGLGGLLIARRVRLKVSVVK